MLKIYKHKGKKRRWFELGEDVRVKLVSADLERRRLTFDFASWSFFPVPWKACAGGIFQDCRRLAFR